MTTESEEKMEKFFVNEELMFSATNFAQFKQLIDQAKKEACQLQSTISKLENFEFTFKLSVAEAVMQDPCSVHPQ